MIRLILFAFSVHDRAAHADATRGFCRHGVRNAPSPAGLLYYILRKFEYGPLRFTDGFS